MGDLPNGFTGWAEVDRGFESAADASRRMRQDAAESEVSPKSPRHARDVSAWTALDDRQGAEVPSVGAAHGGGARQAFENQRSNSISAVQTPNGAARSAAGGRWGAQTSAQERLQTDLRWSWLEIDLSAIRHNVAQVRRVLDPRCRLMAVVKADGYGHGAVEVSKAALGAGADRLAVSSVSEGIALRDAGITCPIAVLEQPPVTSIPALVAYQITPAVYEPDFAVAYGEEADRRGIVAPFHLAVNTGMNRVGVRFDEAAELLAQVSFHRALELEGVFTHFATADSPELFDVRTQLNRFTDALESIRAAGFDPGIVHAANSAAAFRFSDVQFDMVRCGIALYGIHPCEATRDRVDLRPAMSVHARIIDARFVPMSEGVSYGLRYRSPGSVKICTIPVGYADGLMRCLSGRVDFITGGRYHRQVGAICMDQCMFEVDMRSSGSRERLDPQIGDEVIIVGSQGIAAVTMDELAEKASTVPHELMCGFAQRMPRVYL